MTLYRIKLTYCINIDASSQNEAFRQACDQIKAAPNVVISGVEDARFAQHRPVWKRLILGR
jgi:hypothetical protein